MFGLDYLNIDNDVSYFIKQKQEKKNDGKLRQHYI